MVGFTVARLVLEIVVTIKAAFERDHGVSTVVKMRLDQAISLEIIFFVF